jgi:hypothetical protein
LMKVNTQKHSKACEDTPNRVEDHARSGRVRKFGLSHRFQYF